MKTVIKKVSYNKEVGTKFGTMHSFFVEYDDKRGSFLCKNKENPPFTAGQEAEFTETEKEINGAKYYNIKKIKQEFAGNSNFGKALKKEQARYSSFAVSYVKDLIIADKIAIKDWAAASEKIFNTMVELDKRLEA